MSDDPRRGSGFADADARDRPPAPGHAHVTKHDIRLKLDGHANRFGSIARDADDLDPGITGEALDQTLDENRVVVCDEQSYRFQWSPVDRRWNAVGWVLNLNRWGARFEHP